MAIVITADRPDPRFYVKIIQHDDGNWESEAMPLDDVSVQRLGLASFTVPGLRSITKAQVNAYTQELILHYASDVQQRNALFVLSTSTAGSSYDDASAMFTWINTVRVYSNALNDTITTMSFDDITTFSIITAGWPAPPASLL